MTGIKFKPWPKGFRKNSDIVYVTRKEPVMLHLVRIVTHNIEHYKVVWSVGESKWECRDFWSEGYARQFIARQWAHIDAQKVEVE